jgi:hypothetical protein
MPTAPSPDFSRETIMLNHSAFARPAITTMATPATGFGCAEFDEILALARDAGMLITLDGQIGREKYQSIAGSLASFRRFAEALRTTSVA